MNELPELIRAFIAVPIPAEIIEQLTAVQSKLKRELQDVSWTRPEAMHLTLHFLGSMESARLPELATAMTEVASQKASFELSLHGLGSFNNRVLWAGVNGATSELEKLALALRARVMEFGAHEEERKFNAHATLGRFRRPARGVNAILKPYLETNFGTWRVDHVELIRSELSPKGSCYTVLHKAPLRAQ